MFCLCTIFLCSGYPGRPEECVGYTGTGVTEDCGLLCGDGTPTLVLWKSSPCFNHRATSPAPLPLVCFLRQGHSLNLEMDQLASRPMGSFFLNLHAHPESGLHMYASLPSSSYECWGLSLDSHTCTAMFHKLHLLPQTWLKQHIYKHAKQSGEHRSLKRDFDRSRTKKARMDGREEREERAG